MTLVVGDKAPNFTLPSDTEHNHISLNTFRGRKVVLFFYPKNNTPVCTLEVCNFRDKSEQFKQLGVILLGISKDSAKSHRNFKEKYSLPFSLLVDAHGDVCELYGVINKKSLFGKTFLGIQRSTFLIDEKGDISAIWRKVKVTHHVEAVLDAIKSTN